VDHAVLDRLSIVQDGTDGLTRSGTLRLRLPDLRGGAPRLGGWTAAHHYQAGTQHAIAARFGLADPGPAPFATAPTQADQEKVAGLNERNRRMMHARWVTPITVTSGAADAWAPNLGNAATLSPAFFALTAPDQVLRLIELMAGSLPTSDVPAGRRRDYATGAQQIWLHAGRTGP
jgi:hypothetical protein